MRALAGSLALVLAAAAVGYSSGGCSARPTRNPYRDARIATEYQARALAENPFDAATLAPDPNEPARTAMSQVDPWGSSPGSWIARLAHDSAWPELVQSRLIPPRADKPGPAGATAGVTVAAADQPVRWLDLSDADAAVVTAALTELRAWQIECDELRAATAGKPVARVPDSIVANLRVITGTLEALADVVDGELMVHAVRLPPPLAGALPIALSRVLRSTDASARPATEARRLAARGLATCANAGGVRTLVERLGDADNVVATIALRGVTRRGRVLDHRERIGVMTRLVDLLDPTDPVADARALLRGASPESWEAAWAVAVRTAEWLAGRWERFGPALVDPDLAPVIDRARALIAERADHAADPSAVHQLLAWLAPLLPPSGDIATRSRAVLVLRELSGQAMRYRPEASTLARRLATSRWRVWLMSISEPSAPAAMGSPVERLSAPSSTSSSPGVDSDDTGAR